MSVLAGVASVDITPPRGLGMSGFAARLTPAEGAHDALTVRALVVGDTALAVADVIGIDAGMSARVRARCGLPAAQVTLTALHTHGGPVSMAGRLSAEADADYLERLENAFVEALSRARAAQVPVRLSGGIGAEPGAAKNRRHPGGPVDAGVPVLRLDRLDGSPLAVLVSYACHPVVLGADNLRWTADYAFFVRAALEEALPGAIAVFATGCPGDVNTGHSAHASLSVAATATRSYAEAARIGGAVASSALAAALSPLSDTVAATEAFAELPFERRERDPAALAAGWRREAETADPIRAHLVRIWASWAEALPPGTPHPLPARVTALDWGGARLIGLPGEIFAATALGLRERLDGGPVFVLGYADDVPGYIPPKGEYAHGGYEVEEAHRFYGLPAGFAPGGAEALAEAAMTAARMLTTTDQPRGRSK
jgi:hypothetical protein